LCSGTGETDDCVIVEFLKTGRDPGRKARKILGMMFRETDPGAHVERALADFFDPPKRDIDIVRDYNAIRGRMKEEAAATEVAEKYDVDKSTVRNHYRKWKKEEARRRDAGQAYWEKHWAEQDKAIRKFVELTGLWASKIFI
jgi:hypothetical protein